VRSQEKYRHIEKGEIGGRGTSTKAFESCVELKGGAQRRGEIAHLAGELSKRHQESLGLKGGRQR